MPASDTGAVEMALWSLLGARAGRYAGLRKLRRRLGDRRRQAAEAARRARADRADYGKLPDLAAVDPAHDVVFTWNGTTSGVRVPNGDWIAADREGLAHLRRHLGRLRHGAAWDKLDVVTWSWQKVLGGEAAHGMLALSPRAVERLETYKPAWPLPKIFRLTKGGKLIDGIFKGETINTPSMLCVEDALDGLRWAEVGRRPGRADRAQPRPISPRSPPGLSARRGPDFLAEDPATRSSTSICLKIVAPWFTALSRRRPGRGGEEAGRAAGEGRRRLRHRLLSRRAARPAHLGRRDGRNRRYRRPAALARLGAMRQVAAEHAPDRPRSSTRHAESPDQRQAVARRRRDLPPARHRRGSQARPDARRAARDHRRL